MSIQRLGLYFTSVEPNDEGGLVFYEDIEPYLEIVKSLAAVPRASQIDELIEKAEELIGDDIENPT